MPSQPKPATGRGHPWAKGKGQIRTNQAKQGEVLGLAPAGQSQRQIAKATGLNRETVLRILSKEEHSQLLQSYRAVVMTDLVPKALKVMDKRLKAGSEKAGIETLYGSKTFLRHHEVDVSAAPTERDYSDAKVEFYYKYGRWPTLEEAKEFDKMIPVEPLVKKVQ